MNLCQEAFEHLKAALTSSPILVMYCPHQLLTLDMDAFTKGLGVVLFQGEGKQMVGVVIQQPDASSGGI